MIEIDLLNDKIRQEVNLYRHINCKHGKDKSGKKINTKDKDHHSHCQGYQMSYESPIQKLFNFDFQFDRQGLMLSYEFQNIIRDKETIFFFLDKQKKDKRRK